MSSLHSHERLHEALPQAAFETALASLRARGERVTEGRRAVLRALAATSEHLTAEQVVSALESTDPGVHRATVYRTLDVLAELGIVSSVHVSGGANLYHLAASPAGHEHLHAHCRSCGAVVVLPADALDAVVERAHRLAGFRLEASQSTLVGTCARCDGR
ncbi:Fur family transcriptional regulator [Agromyces soli]